MIIMKRFILFSTLVVLFCSGCAAVGDSFPDVIRTDAGDADGFDPLIDMPPDTPPPDNVDVQPDPPPDTSAEDLAVDPADAVDAPDSVDILPEDIVVDDTPVDLGPGTCSASDFPVQLQCNSGYKCTLGTSTSCTAATLCDVPGPQGENQNCTGSSSSDNCQRGFVCLGDGVMSACRKFCNVDSDCAGGNAGCQISISTTACPTGLTGVKTCSHNCDYFYQTGCQTGQACRFLAVPGATRAYSDCTAAGTGVQNSSCPNGSTDCAAGYDCFEIDYGGGDVRLECAKICNFSGGYPTCDGSTTCARGTDWPLPLGACL
jgi:hypothetical protein